MLERLIPFPYSFHLARRLYERDLRERYGDSPEEEAMRALQTAFHDVLIGRWDEALDWIESSRSNLELAQRSVKD